MELRSTPRPISVQRPAWRPRAATYLSPQPHHLPLRPPSPPLLLPPASARCVPGEQCPLALCNPGDPARLHPLGGGRTPSRAQQVTQATWPAAAPPSAIPARRSAASLCIPGMVAGKDSPFGLPTLCPGLFPQLRLCFPAPREMRGGTGWSAAGRTDLQPPSPPVHLEGGRQRLGGVEARGQ